MPKPARSAFRIACLTLLFIALAIRLWCLPSTYLDGDEFGYCRGGLMLAEGLTPTYKAAPGAPVVWLAWLHAMAHAAVNMVHPSPVEASASGVLKPYWAVNGALFDDYYDQTALRHWELGLSIAAGLLLAEAAYALGSKGGGVCGGILLASAVALGPLFVKFSVMTRPYIDAWALGLTAIALAASATTCRRAVWAFVCLGAAVACRVEMLPLVPLVLWQVWPILPRRRVAGWLVLLCLAVAYGLAPWLVTSLLTNIKSIIGVKLLHPDNATPGLGTTLSALALQTGLLFVLPLAALGLARPGVGGSRGRHVVLLILIAPVLISGFFGSGYGIHQEGPMLLAILLLASLALPWAKARWPKGVVGLSLASVAFAAVDLSIARRTWTLMGVSPDLATWVEAHVQAGRPLVWNVLSAKQPLPTVDSSQRLWAFCATEGWRQKYDVLGQHGRFDPSADPPAALSIDNMTKEYTQYRAQFILGSRPTYPAPRYDYAFPPGVFRSETLMEQCKQTLAAGGCVVLPSNDAAIETLGPPTFRFTQPGSAPADVWVGPGAWRD